MICRYEKWLYAHGDNRFITIGRPGFTEQLLTALAAREDDTDGCFLVGPELPDVSATEARRALARGDAPAATALLHPAVCLRGDSPYLGNESWIPHGKVTHKTYCSYVILYDMCWVILSSYGDIRCCADTPVPQGYMVCMTCRALWCGVWFCGTIQCVTSFAECVTSQCFNETTNILILIILPSLWKCFS